MTLECYADRVSDWASSNPSYPAHTRQRTILRLVRDLMANDLDSADSQPSVVQPKRKRKREKERINKASSRRTKLPKQSDGRTSNQYTLTSSAKSVPENKHVPERIDESIGCMDPQLLADYVGQRLRKFEDDKRVAENLFVTGTPTRPYTSIAPN